MFTWNPAKEKPRRRSGEWRPGRPEPDYTFLVLVIATRTQSTATQPHSQAGRQTDWPKTDKNTNKAKHQLLGLVDTGEQVSAPAFQIQLEERTFNKATSTNIALQQGTWGFCLRFDG